MKIAFYSSGGVEPDSAVSPRHFLFPRKREEWDALAESRPEDEISVYCTASATHMIDIAGGELLESSEKVAYHFFPFTDSIDEVADRMKEDGVEAAIAYALPDVPYDWYSVRDALLGDALRKRGIRVVSHTARTAQDCLQKWTFNRILRENGFPVAKGVHVRGGMFHAERRIPEIRNNVYQEFIRSRLEELTYPVVLKAAAGSGSVGLQVAESAEDAFRRLKACTDESDILVEERIDGESFGVEIYGDPDGYVVSDPIIFSIGKDGVTDPFNSIKYGPVRDESYHVEELKEQVKRLGRILGLCGLAELDLIFSKGTWYILEVNPRFSRLSQPVGLMEGWDPFHPLLQTVLPAEQRVFRVKERNYILDFKSKPLPDDMIREIRSRFPLVRHVLKFQYGISGSGEINHCEWVLAAESKEEVEKGLQALREAYPEAVSPAVLEAAGEMMEE